MDNLHVIAAIGKERELGYQNNLLWKMKEDMNYFKEKTWNSYIIMGRKTYESLPKRLENRKYIVLSRTLKDKSILIYSDINDLLQFVQSTSSSFYVIGGGEIYDLLLPYVDVMYLTEIEDRKPYADTFFPPFDVDEWIVDIESSHLNQDIPYKHVRYIRKNKSQD